jgi:hypothetical protein
MTRGCCTTVRTLRLNGLFETMKGAGLGVEETDIIGPVEEEARMSLKKRRRGGQLEAKFCTSVALIGLNSCFSFDDM